MSLEDAPSYFAITTGINETTAQLILSIAIIFTILLPYVVVCKGKPNPIVSLILLFMGEAISLGLGWSPFWIMIMFMALTAIGIAQLGTKGVTGG